MNNNELDLTLSDIKSFSMTETKKPVLNKKFNTKAFSQLRNEVEVVNKEYTKLVRKCSQAIAYELVATERGMNIIQSKMNSAKKLGKNSTNIYEIDLYERIILINEKYIDEDNKEQDLESLYRVRKIDIENGYLDYKNKNEELKRIEVKDDIGVAIADLIKGPKNDKSWMIRNNIKTIPEILQESFRESCTQDIMESIIEDMNKNLVENEKEFDLESFSAETWKNLINNYIKEKNYVFPQIYYHFNRNWGEGEKRGKFAIELDWSGDDPAKHSGMRAGQIYNKDNYNKKNKMNNINSKRRRRNRNSDKEVKEFIN